MHGRMVALADQTRAGADDSRRTYAAAGRCDRPGYPLHSTCRCFLGRRVYSPRRLRRGTPVCSLCEALLNGQHPAGHPSLPLMACALRRKSTGPQRRAENNDREVNRRTVAPRSRASCMHLPYARIPLSGAHFLPGHFFFMYQEQTDGTRHVYSLQTFRHQPRPAKPHRRLEGNHQPKRLKNWEAQVKQQAF